MPRKPRHFLVNVPCHIISRGNNHNVSFFAIDDKAKRVQKATKGTSHLNIKTILKKVTPLMRYDFNYAILSALLLSC